MKILVSVPNTGWIHKHVSMALLRLQHDRRYPLSIIQPTHNPLENNLNHIVRDVLKGDYDYWLTIDADNPPTKNPLDLVELDKDVIAYPTPQWHSTHDEQARGQYPIYWNCMDVQDEGWTEHQPKTGLQEIEACGSACMLVARRVLEQAPPFRRVYHEDGTVNYGHDFAWCANLRQLGFSIWAHYDYPCLHFKEIELTEMMRAFQQYGVHHA